MTATEARPVTAAEVHPVAQLALTGRRVVVTGGSGIGAACAARLAASRART